MENHQAPSQQPYVSKTLQDNLFETFKIFWKAGYSYGNARVLEDIMNMNQSDFLKKYNNGN
jgi:hypothetical protein